KIGGPPPPSRLSLSGVEAALEPPAAPLALTTPLPPSAGRKRVGAVVPSFPIAQGAAMGTWFRRPRQAQSARRPLRHRTCLAVENLEDRSLMDAGGFLQTA